MFNAEQVQALAARKLTEQQIADVLNIDLEELKKDRVSLSRFREEIRKGVSRGEAEIRTALYKRARNGDSYAYEVLRRRVQNSED